MERDSEPVVRPYAVWLAALVPFCVYVWTTGASSYWLDSGEFTAAAIDLDIAHPPGHPLNSLWSKPFTLLPLGPLPFRVALAQGTASALALAALCVAFARSLLRVGLDVRAAREQLALGGTWLLASSYAFWFQSVRQEVYALQALLVCVSLERLTRAAELRARGQSDARPFYAAVLALGVGLANHHFISVLGIPAILLELALLSRRLGLRPWLVGLGLALLGLCGYAYLPLRASTLPPMDLGHPLALRELAWVVSAQVYARHVGLAAHQPLGERLLDLVVLIVDNLSWPVLLLALLGLYGLGRRRALWGLGWIWGVTAWVSLVGRALLNEVRGNPDVLGYMMPGFAALVGLALCGVAMMLGVIGRERFTRAVAMGTLLLAPLGFVLQSARASLADFHATDDFDTPRRRELPEGALLVLATPDSVFRHWDGQAVERLRPDVTLLPLPFIGYGASGGVLAARQPELAPLIRAYQEHDRLDVNALRALARTRPVRVEADATETLALYPYLVPEGLLFRLLPTPPALDEVRRAARDRSAAIARLLRELRTSRPPASLLAEEDEETRRKLLWILYVDALYYTSHGALELATTTTELALHIAPETSQLVALYRAIMVERAQRSSEGPIDIRPFLVH
jgi:hypothetical protein